MQASRRTVAQSHELLLYGPGGMSRLSWLGERACINT